MAGCFSLPIVLVLYWSLSRSMFSHAINTDKGLIRSSNQDYCLVLPEIGLYILADGMGGARGGERASQLAADTVAEVVQSASASRCLGAARSGGASKPAGAR